MSWDEILFGIYGIIALIIGTFIFLKLLADRDELLAFSFLEKSVLIMIWFIVSGAMGISWPLVAFVVIIPRVWEDRHLERY